jgi:hypothetical protein
LHSRYCVAPSAIEIEIEAYGPAPSSGAVVHWLVTDHLGTPRMVLDQTCSLANLKRHDYLAFGERDVEAASGMPYRKYMGPIY